MPCTAHPRTGRAPSTSTSASTGWTEEGGAEPERSARLLVPAVGQHHFAFAFTATDTVYPVLGAQPIHLTPAPLV